MNTYDQLTQCETLPAAPARTEAWHAQRLTGIGGSDVPAVVGLSKWKTRLELYLEKRNLVPPAPMNQYMRRGILLEPVILGRYAEETGAQVVSPKDVTFRSRETPIMLANLDGLRLKGPDIERGVEVKNSDRMDVWGPSGSDTYPPEYYLQCQHYMLVTGLKLWDLMAFLPRGEERIYTVEADSDVQDSIRAQCSEFWQLVQDETPPDPDFQHPSTPDLLKRLHGADGMIDDVITLPDTYASIAERMVGFKEQAKYVQDELAALEAQLRHAVGDYREASIGDTGIKIVRRSITRKEHTVKESKYVSFKINYPKGEQNSGE